MALVARRAIIVLGSLSAFSRPRLVWHWNSAVGTLEYNHCRVVQGLGDLGNFYSFHKDFSPFWPYVMSLISSCLLYLVAPHPPRLMTSLIVCAILDFFLYSGPPSPKDCPGHHAVGSTVSSGCYVLVFHRFGSLKFGRGLRLLEFQ